MKGNFELNGYIFDNRSDFEKAKKEAEAISYISSNSELENAVLAKKIYEKLLDKGTFQTIIGYTFLNDVRRTILNEGNIEEGSIRSIPIKRTAPMVQEAKEEISNEEVKKVNYLQARYEKERNKNKSLLIITIFLTLVIIGMFVTAQLTPYTIFTDYETKIVNQYEEWQNQLEEREAELKDREQALGIKE